MKSPIGENRKKKSVGLDPLTERAAIWGSKYADGKQRKVRFTLKSLDYFQLASER